jgi:hypothetical protein
MEGVHAMHGQSRLGRWGILLMLLLVGVTVGLGAYRLGVAHGLAINVATVAGPEAAKAPNAQVAPYGPYPYPYAYPYGWHGHWGWGFFPFGFFIPFLFFGLWFFALRMLFWGGPWRRHWYDRHRGRHL